MEIKGELNDGITSNINLFDTGLKINGDYTITNSSNGSYITVEPPEPDYPISFNIPNRKEESKKMLGEEIVDIYEKERLDSLEREYEHNIKEIYAKDPVESMIRETLNKIESLYGDKMSYNMSDLADFRMYGIHLEKTKKAIEEERQWYNKKKEKLNAEIKKIKAMLKMTSNYTEAMDVLKRYKVVED